MHAKKHYDITKNKKKRDEGAKSGTSTTAFLSSLASGFFSFFNMIPHQLACTLALISVTSWYSLNLVDLVAFWVNFRYTAAGKVPA